MLRIIINLSRTVAINRSMTVVINGNRTRGRVTSVIVSGCIAMKFLRLLEAVPIAKKNQIRNTHTVTLKVDSR